MGLSLWIGPELQYGVLEPGEARQGTLQRRFVQALQQFFFQSQSSYDYEPVLGRFRARLNAELHIGKDWEAAMRAWQVLLPASADPATDEECAERLEGLFCLAVHTLCGVLAQQWLDTRHTQDALEDDSLDADDLDDVDDADDLDDLALGDHLMGAEYEQVRAALSVLLQQLAWKWLRDLPEDEEPPQSNDWRLLSEIVLDNLLHSLEQWFVVETGETTHQQGKVRTARRISIRDPKLAQRIEYLLKALPLSFTPQPLKQPLTYCFDNPAISEEAAQLCIRVDLIGYRQSNKFLRDTHRKILHTQHRPPAFARYVQAINNQQAVPWRINRPLLTWVRQLIAVSDEVASPPAQADLRDWVRKNLYRPLTERPRPTARKQTGDEVGARPAEFLDSPLAHKALEALCPLDLQSAPPTFYLPWKADYRGRIYPQTPWFSPQGGDLQRALLEFAQGQVLNEAGVSALRRHGANLVQRSRLLRDLGITDRQVVTLQERERWVCDHEQDILASAADPLAESFWREVADKPMQFLAFCLAYQQWHHNPAALVHLPVQIDGTCNGLQHIAALTGDKALAEAVNVLPRADGLPADIYSDLAMAARASLGHLDFSKGKHGKHREGLQWADAWLMNDAARKKWLDRKTAKKVVMTIPYGAGIEAQARGVLEAIEDEVLKAFQDAPPSAALLDWRDAQKVRRGFVTRCTRDLFEEARTAAFQEKYSAPDKATKDRGSAETYWDSLRTLGAYVALALVVHLHDALNKHYPGVRKFSDWLGQCANACAGTGRKTKNKSDKDIGLPLLWLSPLGFPVIQNKFEYDKTTVTATLGSHKIRLNVQRLNDHLDPQKQHNALLPNLIHSLDATHLMKTLLAAESHGITDIGSVHDCLLCHPNQAETLAQVVRQTFATLYAVDAETGIPKPLSDWYQWIKSMVELRTLQRRGEIQAMLDYPGEIGECMLEQAVKQNQPGAAIAHAWLRQFRETMPASESVLLRQLLARAGVLPTPESMPELQGPPVSAALALHENTISPYFFS